MTDSNTEEAKDDDMVEVVVEVRVCHCDSDEFNILRGGEIRCIKCGCVDETMQCYEVAEVEGKTH